jgi:transposase
VALSPARYGNHRTRGPRGTEHGSGLGVYRWVVEAAFALLHWFRRLRIRGYNLPAILSMPFAQMG